MTTRQRIVTAMAELLRHQGYAATGISQLAEAAGAPTGSIYHHFKKGKREVAAAVLRETGAAYIQLIPLLLDEHHDLPAGLEAAFAQAAETMESTGWANMCPVGTVLGEIADTEPGLRRVGDEVVTSWVAEGVRYFTTRGLAPDGARALTYALISALEGGFILARGQRSREPLIAAGRSIAAFARTLPTAGRAAPDPMPEARPGMARRSQRSG
jgi:AcrR family transcriptional regulator